MVPFLKKSLRRVALNLFHLEKEIIYRLDLKDELKPFEAGIEIELKTGTVEDLDAMDEKALEFDEKGKRYVLGRMKKGDDFILVMHEGKIVGYHLVMKGAMEFSMRKIVNLPPTWVYLYKGFVRKNYRGKGIIRYLIYDTAVSLKKKGFKTLIMTVSVKNLPMLRVIEKMKFRPLGTISLIRFLGVEIPFVSKRTIKALKAPE